MVLPNATSPPVANGGEANDLPKLDDQMEILSSGKGFKLDLLEENDLDEAADDPVFAV